MMDGLRVLYVELEKVTGRGSGGRRHFPPLICPDTSRPPATLTAENTVRCDHPLGGPLLIAEAGRVSPFQSCAGRAGSPDSTR